MFKEQSPPRVLEHEFAAILSLAAVIRPAPFKQQRHAGSGQSLIMRECLSTLGKGRVKNKGGTGLWGGRGAERECLIASGSVLSYLIEGDQCIYVSLLKRLFAFVYVH